MYFIVSIHFNPWVWVWVEQLLKQLTLVVARAIASCISGLSVVKSEVQ
jgi:hypothetical protein